MIIKKLDKKLAVLTGALVLLLVVTGTAVGLNGYFGGGSGSEDINNATLTQGLVGYWNFEDGTGTTANDSSDQNNDGTLTNGPAWTSGKAGNGGALDFDGTDDFVKASPGEIPSAYTVSLWYRNSAVPGSAVIDQPFTWNSAAADDGISFSWDHTTSTFQQAWAPWDGAYQALKYTTSLQANTWYFLILTYDGTTARAYLNGVEEVSKAIGAATDAGAETVNIGAGLGATDSFDDGIIDEVRIYNRALSAAEVRYLYNRGGPVGHWKFDEGAGSTAFDSAGSNDGTLTNMDAATDWVSGQYGTALDFDGSNDYVSLGSPAVLDDIAVITICAWIRPDALTADDMRIYAKDDNTGNNGKLLLIEEVNDRLEFRQGWSGGDSSWRSPNNSLVANTWQHVCVSYDSGSTANDSLMYINGESVTVTEGIAPSGSVDSDAASTATIGGISTGTRQFDGQIDDVRIYNYARTAAEIRADYNAGFAAKFGGSPNQDVTRGLVGYWTFEDGTGTTANDSSDQNNDGTLTNGPTWTSGKAGNGGALDFDGGNDVLDVGAPSVLQDFEPFTLTAWLYPRAFSAVQSTHIISKCDAAGCTGGWNFGFTSGPSKKDLLFTKDYSGTNLSRVGQENLVANEWQFVTMTWDGSATASNIHLYRNGVEVSYVSTTNGTGSKISDAGENLVIGAGAASGINSCDCLIDDVRIYNRALSAAEVRYLYNRGGPVAHWKLDEGSGTTTVFDSAGSVDGTLNGMEEGDWVQGKFGTALEFDGTAGEYVNMGSDLGINAYPFTITGWGKTSEASNDVLAFLVNSGAGNVQYGLYAQSDVMSVFARNTTGISALGTTNIADNQWHHFVAVFVSATDRRLYVDGVQEGSSTTSVSFNTNVNNFDIGRSGDSTPCCSWSGQIDDVRVYNYARSAEEVRQDYNAGFAAKFGGSPNQDVTRGLVGYWNFEDGTGTTANDSSDQNNDGTLTNGPAWISGKAGNGGALDFDGSNDFLDIADTDALDLTDTSTIVAWIKPSTLTDTDRIVDKGGGTTGRNGWTFELGANSDVSYRTNDVGCGTSNDNVLSLDTWKQVAAVHDGTNITFYVDGRAEGSSACSKPLADTHRVNIGRKADVSANFFEGQIDEVRIYNRALTVAEIRYLYNKGGPIAHWKFDEGSGEIAHGSRDQEIEDVTNGLVGHWKMDDNVSGNAQTLTDSSGNGNNGTTDDGANNTGMDCTVTGRIERGCDFDGADDIVTVSDSSSLDAGLENNGITVSLWAKVDDFGGGDDPSFFDKSNGDNFMLGLDGANEDAPRFRLTTTAGTVTQAASVISTGTWYHFVGLYDGSNMYLYQNNVVVATNAQSGTIVMPVGDVHIGGRTNFSSRIDGIIDDVRVYNRALTGEEVATLFNLRSKELMLVSSPSWVAGKHGTALDFDGTADYGVNADKNDFDFGDTEDLTITGWFNRDTATSDDVIVAKRNSLSTATDVGYIAYLDATGDNLIFEVSDGTDEYSLTSSSSFTSTGWNHFSIVWDQDSAASSEIYINGTANSATDTGTIGNIGSLSNAVDFRIATESDGGSPFDGKLDDIRIYNYARTVDEIRQDYNNGLSTHFR